MSMSNMRPTIRKKNKNKNKNRNKRSFGNLSRGLGSSERLAQRVFGVIQVVNANKNNINVSTGATTYNNPTTSATYFNSSTSNLTADPCFGMFFTLNDIPQVSTFTALYDQYRFKRITVNFIPTVNITGPQNAANSVNQNCNQIFVAVDHDDASVVSPLTSLFEYEDVKLHNTMEQFSVSFIPHVAAAVYSGAFTSFANQTTPWLDCASPNIQHYGIKWAMPCPISLSFACNAMSLLVKYEIEFRTLR